MPCYSWSIPAENCKVGSMLRALAKTRGIPTTCGSCYALKGRYVFPNVRARLRLRLEAYNACPEAWAAAMIETLRVLGASRSARTRERARFFRFFDSGDIQSAEMLAMIVHIARALPHVHFWIPTRERGIVLAYLRDNGPFPENMTVRLSAPIIGKPMPGLPGNPYTSTVSAHVGRACPAPQQSNTCGDCRACWSRDIENVDYHKH
jgi:hypothetical protein